MKKKEEKEEKIDWHKILQKILDEHLSLMSGKEIEKGEREFQQYFLVDYYCKTKKSEKKQGFVPKIKPFEHLKEHNLIEYKSINEVLNETMFRKYVARALYLENSDKETKQGKMTLTLFTTRTPTQLLKKEVYQFKAITKWKYRCEWIEDLEIYLLIQKEIREIKGGEGLALLQVLEGEKDKQAKVWNDLFHQELKNIKVIEKIMYEINEEVGMTLAEHYEKIGIKKGKKLAEADKTTLAEHYEKIGIKKGIKKGIEKGIEKGKIEGKIEDVLKLMKLKFKKVPASWTKAVKKITEEKVIEKLFENVALAENKEDLEKILRQLK